MKLYTRLAESPKGRRFAARRRSSIHRQVNLAAFGSLPNNPNSYNVKHLNRGPSFPATVDDAAGGGTDLIDDAQIRALISPNAFQEESSQYLSLRTTEKLTVNLLQCLTHTGIQVLQDHIRTQVLDSYLKTEKKLKFRNKGLLYLLSLFEKDVNKLLQFSRHKQAVQKAESTRLKYQAVARERTQDDGDSKTGEAHAERASIAKTDGEGRPVGNELPNLLQMQGAKSIDRIRSGSPSKASANKVGKHQTIPAALRRQRSPSPRLGYLPSMAKGTRLQATKSATRAAGGSSPSKDALQIKRQAELERAVSKQTAKAIHPAPEFARVRKPRAFIPPQIEPESKIFLYEVNEDAEFEQMKYLFWVKDKLRLFKAMFRQYAAGSVGKAKVSANTFESKQKQGGSMNLTALHTFLADFKISKFEFARRDEIK